MCDPGNGWTTAINLPGIGSQVQVRNVSFQNYQKAIYGCAWCVAHRGGYEMEFWNVSMVNVEHIAHFKHGVGGILIDGDGSLVNSYSTQEIVSSLPLNGTAGGTIVPPTGQWRTNSNCTQHAGGTFTHCSSIVRRVNVGISQWRSPWWDTNIKKHYPLLIAVDITDEDLTLAWDKWNRDLDETRQSCMGNLVFCVRRWDSCRRRCRCIRH